MWRYRSATDFADTAKYLREESVEIAGVKVACYVVTVSPEKRKLTYTWWVEKKAYHVVRGMTAETARCLRPSSSHRDRSPTRFSILSRPQALEK